MNQLMLDILYKDVDTAALPLDPSFQQFLSSMLDHDPRQRPLTAAAAFDQLTGNSFR
jgi:hypothetical protein